MYFYLLKFFVWEFFDLVVFGFVVEVEVVVFFLVFYFWEFLVWLVGEGVGGSDCDLDLVGDFLVILVVLVDFEFFEYILVGWYLKY